MVGLVAPSTRFIPAAAMLASVQCQDVEFLGTPYEAQLYSALNLQFWPGPSGGQSGITDLELTAKNVVQVIARWQDWVLALSGLFPWYPHAASCGWLRADQLVPFDSA